jgi:hypothetical protein
VELDKYVTIPDGEFHALRGLYKRFCNLRNGYWEHAEDIKKKTDLNPDRYTGHHVDIPDQTSAHVLHLQVEQLLKIAKTRRLHWARDVANDQVLALKNIISIMASPSATISYKKTGDVEKMIITSGKGNLERAITAFLTLITPDANVCFLSGTMIENRPGLFTDLVGREVTCVIFPDLCNTNAKMHIYPSKWKFSAYDANNGIERAIKEIVKINEKVGHKPIYLIGMSEHIKDQLMKGLRGCTNIKSDYYRSEDSMGVEHEERIAIAVGLAHTPRHSCDPLAQGADDQERYLDSQQLRLNEVRAATFQAISRVKDHNGVVESHAYCVGIRADEISDVVTWGTNRTIKASTDGNGKLDWTVHVDQELDRPIVHAEERTSKGLSRHDIREYIDKVQSIKYLIEHRRNSQESIQFPYNNNNDYRENVDIFGNSESLSLYNSPGNPDELEATSFASRMLFAGRSDCYSGRSKKPGKDGEYGFRKKDIATDVPGIIKGHLNGSETIGFYPFDTDDQCYYNAFDIKERDNAMKLAHFMLDNGLPVLVEKMVSPESYHIRVPIIPTKTLTVYKFGKQLLHDAGVKGADVYPRQKSISSCHKGSCGDFMMLPLGIDKEKNRISVFIDPRTFEPVDSVDIDKVIAFEKHQNPKQ